MSQLFSGKDNLRRFSQQPATLLSLTCDSTHTGAHRPACNEKLQTHFHHGGIDVGEVSAGVEGLEHGLGAAGEGAFKQHFLAGDHLHGLVQVYQCVVEV